MSKPVDGADGRAILARYHARHGVRSLVCPVCMRPSKRRRAGTRR